MVGFNLPKNSNLEKNNELHVVETVEGFELAEVMKLYNIVKSDGLSPNYTYKSLKELDKVVLIRMIIDYFNKDARIFTDGEFYKDLVSKIGIERAKIYADSYYFNQSSNLVFNEIKEVFNVELNKDSSGIDRWNQWSMLKRLINLLK